MKTIYVLWLRQIKRYMRSKPRIIGSLGQPLLFLLALGFGFGPIYQKAGGGDYIQFIVPGIMAMSVLFTSLFSGLEIIWDRQFGFLKETLVAPVSRFEIMIGRTLGGATVATFQGTLIFLLSLAVGFRPPSASSVLLAVLFMFLIALFFAAVGTAFASRMADAQGFQLIVNFLVMPTFFLSGALFPLQGLPAPIQMLAWVNPLSYGVDGLRSSVTLASNFGILHDLTVLAAVTAIALFVGERLFSKLEA